MKTCQKCGRNVGDWKFCGFCGAKVDNLVLTYDNTNSLLRQNVVLENISFTNQMSTPTENDLLQPEEIHSNSIQNVGTSTEFNELPDDHNLFNKGAMEFRNTDTMCETLETVAFSKASDPSVSNIIINDAIDLSESVNVKGTEQVASEDSETHFESIYFDVVDTEESIIPSVLDDSDIDNALGLDTPAIEVHPLEVQNEETQVIKPDLVASHVEDSVIEATKVELEETEGLNIETLFGVTTVENNGEDSLAEETNVTPVVNIETEDIDNSDDSEDVATQKEFDKNKEDFDAKPLVEEFSPVDFDEITEIQNKLDADKSLSVELNEVDAVAHTVPMATQIEDVSVAHTQLISNEDNVDDEVLITSSQVGDFEEKVTQPLEEYVPNEETLTTEAYEEDIVTEEVPVVSSVVEDMCERHTQLIPDEMNVSEEENSLEAESFEEGETQPTPDDVIREKEAWDVSKTGDVESSAEGLQVDEEVSCQGKQKEPVNKYNPSITFSDIDPMFGGAVTFDVDSIKEEYKLKINDMTDKKKKGFFWKK